MQSIICFLMFCYMWFVYFSSRKTFVNSQNILNHIQNNKSLIFVFWHNRLMMIPFISVKVIAGMNKKYQMMTLASNHGDGKFVGRVMEKFNFKSILGSSKSGRKKNKGIDLHSLREIIRGLKNGNGFGITPDGPRGPNQKINSEIISIAKITKTDIIPISYSSSKFIHFNSWDRFKLPLPFGKLCFYFGEVISIIDEFAVKDEQFLRNLLEEKMNEVQDLSEKAL